MFSAREFLTTLARKLTPPMAFALLVWWALEHWGRTWPPALLYFGRAIVVLAFLLYALREVRRIYQAASDGPRPKPPAAGARRVTVHGEVRDSVIVTGDGNTVEVHHGED